MIGESLPTLYSFARYAVHSPISSNNCGDAVPFILHLKILVDRYQFRRKPAFYSTNQSHHFSIHFSTSILNCLSIFPWSALAWAPCLSFIPATYSNFHIWHTTSTHSLHHLSSPILSTNSLHQFSPPTPLTNSPFPSVPSFQYFSSKRFFNTTKAKFRIRESIDSAFHFRSPF